MVKPKTEPGIEVFYERYPFGTPEIDEVAEDYHARAIVYDSGEEDEEDEEEFPKDENDKEDRIGKLPNDTLHFIISLLSMREGAATGVLSRRWRNLWSESATHLEFDDTNLFGQRYPRDILDSKEKEPQEEEGHCPKTKTKHFSQCRRSQRKELVETDRARFVNLVDQILTLRSASKVNKLSVRFPIGAESAAHIDRWVKLAAAQGILKLKLNLDWTYFKHREWRPSNRYALDVQQFGSSLKHMRLDFCTFNLPSHFRGLNSLKYLDLYNCSFNNGDMQDMLSKFPSLKWLSIRFCEFPDPTSLKFVGASIPLRHLHIGACQNIKEIKVQDVGLLSCELKAVNEKISIKNVPYLKVLLLHIKGNVEILGSFSHLRTLCLRHRGSELKLPDFSALKSVKQLKFSANKNVSNLFEVVCLLKTFPLLERLEIDMGHFDGVYSELSEVSARVATTPGCPHNNLREVNIRAFESYPELIDLAKYLLKNATALEKMKIFTTCLSYAGNGVWRTTYDGKLKDTALEEVSKLLKKEARPSTTLEFFPPE